MKSRPNIIFMLSDQQRWDTLGCYGQSLPVTPNLDYLASIGTKFEYTFTCQPVCGPARACLQTGKYAVELGCAANATALPKGHKTVAQYLDEAGYHTAMVGKWHLGSDLGTSGTNNYANAPVPEEKRGGFQYWMGSDCLEFTSCAYNGYVFNGNMKRVDFIGPRTDCIQNFALDYIRKYKSRDPFYLYIAHIDPHHQNDHGRVDGPDMSKARFGNYKVPADLIGTDGNWRENMPDYLGACNALDFNVGRLIDCLKEKGIWENTVIIYSSDHGTHFLTRNREYKRTAHDNSIRVPLIIAGPGFEGGNTEQCMASLIDLPATILDIAGIEKPDDYQGVSLKKVISGEEEAPSEAFLEISENHIGRAVRTRKWTYSARACGNAAKEADAELFYDDLLYDNENDPAQKHNLVGKPGYEEVLKEMRALTEKYMRTARERPDSRILPSSEAPEEWKKWSPFDKSSLTPVPHAYTDFDER
jgi:arylsulfatase A-like enzyme